MKKKHILAIVLTALAALVVLYALFWRETAGQTTVVSLPSPEPAESAPVESAPAEEFASVTADTVQAALSSGDLQVFDTSTFTVDGQELTTCLALDTDGDYVADSEEAVFDGAFHESLFQSAPYFAVRIDGIQWLNEAY